LKAVLWVAEWFEEAELDLEWGRKSRAEFMWMLTAVIGEVVEKESKKDGGCSSWGEEETGQPR
jgi:hypothetical protein